MPVWPKSIYVFGLSLKTAATEWKLRQKRAAPRVQQRAFKTLVTQLAGASFWRESGVEGGMTYAQFQSRVPLRGYEQLAPAIARARRGEADVVWPGRCALFALTAGTTTGQPKSLPITEEMLAHFRQAGRDALLYYTVRVRHAGVFRGRHLLVGGSTALVPLPESAGAFAGGLSAIAAVDLAAWVEKHLYEPGTAAGAHPDWEARIDAIVSRTCLCDISLLAGLPTWIAQFAHELRVRLDNSGQRVSHLQTLWPNLECFIHTGVPLGPVAENLRTLLGPSVKFHEIYASAEGVFATQDSDAAGAGLRLMADTGIFFEFLPMSEFDEARLPQLGAKAVPLADAQTGTDYALVVTTPAGLARYVLGDVVRFVSLHPPRLVYVGRTTLRANLFGEHLMEKDVTDALVGVCTRHGWMLINFHVAPLPTNTLTGAARGRHEWWIELKPGTVATPTGPQIAIELDGELQRTNPDYTAKRKTGVIEAPIVRLVMPGVFEHWLRYQQRWGGEHKLARCRSDRLIADELAQIAPFARD